MDRPCAGAHALLQHPPDRADAPSEGDVQCAADLAAYFSKVALSVCLSWGSVRLVPQGRSCSFNGLHPSVRWLAAAADSPTHFFIWLLSNAGAGHLVLRMLNVNANASCVLRQARQNTRCEVITTAPKHLSRPKVWRQPRPDIMQPVALLAPPES